MPALGIPQPATPADAGKSVCADAPGKIAVLGKTPWHIPLLLCLPAFFPLLYQSWLAWASGLIPTGFVQVDMASYAANGREHFDQGFQWTYGNPYAGYGMPAIYFQPHTFLLGVLQKLGLGPAVALNVFGVAAVILAAMAATRLYEEVVGWQTSAQKLGLVCFFWGGGILSLLGLAFGLPSGTPFAKASLLFDPMDGWWTLNFGRNLVFPTEAYYHGVFLLAILMLIRQRRAAALALTVLLCASHPYAGLSLALVFLTYAAIELILASRAASLPFFAGAVVIFAAHMGYYELFLNQFEEHRVLRAQWEMDWPYLFWTAFPALYLVGIFALVPLTRWKNLQPALQDPQKRLFLVLFAVILGLTHHDLFMKPVQQLHFARGYDWIALFFLGAPGLLKVLDRMSSIHSTLPRAAAVGLFLLLMTSDNLLWFASFHDPSVQHYSIAIDSNERDTLRWLSRHAEPPALVASSSGNINYLTSTYTRVRSWFGHDYNTPHGYERREEVRNVFAHGGQLPAQGPVYYIPKRSLHWSAPEGARQVYENGGYEIWFATTKPAEDR